MYRDRYRQNNLIRLHKSTGRTPKRKKAVNRRLLLKSFSYQIPHFIIRSNLSKKVGSMVAERLGSTFEEEFSFTAP